MALAFADRTRVTTATTGTGTMSLGSAVSGCRSFDQAVTDGALASGNTVNYAIEDGSNWEVGQGVFTSGTPSTLTRATVFASSAGGTTKITLSGSAQVFIAQVASREASLLVNSNNLSDVSSAKNARNNLDRGTFGLASAATITPNCATDNVFTLTLAINATLANPLNMQAGAHYTFVIQQDATGGRTLSYGTAFKFPNAAPPTLSTAANAIDILSCVYDGTNLYAVMSNSFG